VRAVRQTCVGGFLDAFGVERIGEVRLADNTGEYEIHLPPARARSTSARCSAGSRVPATDTIT
jgi:hypothetical protein